jgi:hypothetical protein
MKKQSVVEQVLGTPTETQNFTTFADFTPYERQMIVAELYHNAWYNQERFEEMYDLYNKWANNPIKDKKFIIPETNENEEQLLD